MGGRTSALENRMDDATAVLEGHEQEIDALRTELDVLKDKQECLENRFRRCNLRIRGLPEAVASSITLKIHLSHTLVCLNTIRDLCLMYV